MATLTQDELLDQIGAMTLVEVADFIKKFEAKFGVTAAAPVATAAAPVAAAAAVEVAEEQTEFTAVLAEIGPNKIPVIKVVRELTGFGSRRPRTWSTRPPSPSRRASRDEAEKIKAALEAQGAKVEIK